MGARAGSGHDDIWVTQFFSPLFIKHGTERQDEVFSALDFIAAITQHIPAQSFQLVRYYGVSSLAYLAGTPTVCGATGRSVKPKREEWRQRLLPAWKLSTFQITGPHGSHRRCGGSVPQGHLLRGHIKKIWEVDPLSCPRCHAEMKIISFIVQPDVIKKILVYLELWEEFSKRRPPPLALAAEKAEVATGRIHDLFDDGWSGYEDPWLDVHSL